MKLGYEKLMEENEISLTDLPRNLQVAVTELTELKNRVLAKTNIGQNVSEQTIERIKVKDEFLIKEIYDLFEDEQEEDDSEDDSEDIEDNDMNIEDGARIDQELFVLYKNGTTKISFAQLKNSSHATFEHLWNAYSAGEENGIVTSNFELIETEIDSEEFNLNKL